MAPDVFEKTWERIALAGCLVTAIGSVPVWFTLHIDEGLATLLDEPGTVTRGGIDGDGILTLMFALLVVVALAVATYRTDDGPGWKTSTLTLLSGIFSGLLAAMAYFDMQGLRDQLASYESEGGINGTLAQNLSVEVHAALYVVLVGSALILLGGLVGTIHELRSEDGPDTGPETPGAGFE